MKLWFKGIHSHYNALFTCTYIVYTDLKQETGTFIETKKEKLSDLQSKNKILQSFL